GAVSPAVAELATGALQAMSLSRLTVATILGLVLAVGGLGVGVLAHPLLVAKPADDKPAAQARQAPADDGRPTDDPSHDPLPTGGLARLGTLRFRHGASVNSVAFSPDGTTLVAGTSEWRSGLWEVATGTQLRVLEGHASWVLGASSSPDGKLIATGSNDQT